MRGTKKRTLIPARPYVYLYAQAWWSRCLSSSSGNRCRSSSATYTHSHAATHEAMCTQSIMTPAATRECVPHTWNRRPVPKPSLT